MQLSKIIAKMASIVYLSASLGAFFSAEHYRRVGDDLFGNAGLTYLTGFVTVIIGFLIVNYHNTWAKNWTVLITVLGWLALLKGIVLIVCPQFVHDLSVRIVTEGGLRIFLYVSLCLGLLFAFFGFVSSKYPNKPTCLFCMQRRKPYKSPHPLPGRKAHRPSP